MTQTRRQNKLMQICRKNSLRSHSQSMLLDCIQDDCCVLCCLSRIQGQGGDGIVSCDLVGSFSIGIYIPQKRPINVFHTMGASGLVSNDEKAINVLVNNTAGMKQLRQVHKANGLPFHWS